MKKLLLIAMLLFSSLTMARSVSSTVTIYGKAANYLYYDYSGELTFTQCVRGARSPYLGTVECVIEANEVRKVLPIVIKIYGLGAKELYKKFKNKDPDKTGIACFVEQLRRGQNKVGCELEARVVETNGLE